MIHQQFHSTIQAELLINKTKESNAKLILVVIQLLVDWVVNFEKIMDAARNPFIANLSNPD